jgi:hypothetical protein
VRSQRSEGLIFVDPQSFSRSKRMTGTLDVQRDHVQLIRAAAALLEADGLLLFYALAALSPRCRRVVQSSDQGHLSPIAAKRLRSPSSPSLFRPAKTRRLIVARPAKS